ncbi:hypothetical protein IAT38_006911 [Cryptococcus sp. DSM 104549]
MPPGQLPPRRQPGTVVEWIDSLPNTYVQTTSPPVVEPSEIQIMRDQYSNSGYDDFELFEQGAGDGLLPPLEGDPDMDMEEQWLMPRDIVWSHKSGSSLPPPTTPTEETYASGIGARAFETALMNNTRRGRYATLRCTGPSTRTFTSQRSGNRQATVWPKLELQPEKPNSQGIWNWNLEATLTEQQTDKLFDGEHLGRESLLTVTRMKVPKDNVETTVKQRLFKELMGGTGIQHTVGMPAVLPPRSPSRSENGEEGYQREYEHEIECGAVVATRRGFTETPLKMVFGLELVDAPGNDD